LSLRYLSDLLLLGDKTAQAFEKTFNSQQALTVKLIPNGLTANPILDKLALLLLCDWLAMTEVI
jgi:hypothetical protein